MTDVLGRLLLLVSNALLVPVMLLLLGLCALNVLYAGGFVAEAVARRRRCPAFRAFVRALRRSERAGATVADLPPGPQLLEPAIAEFRHSSRAIDKLLDDLQLRAESLLGRLHVCIRLGPMLGLAGTLIPLGPALDALAEGDTRSLGDNLIIAFATTVVGLFVGGVCFAIHATRQRWYNQDINDLQFILNRLNQSKKHDQTAIQPCGISDDE